MKPGRDLCPEQIHVYWADLDATCWTAVAATSRGVLSPNELARASRYRFEKDARRYMLSHLLIRGLLGLYLGEPASEIVIQHSSLGKPHLARSRHGLHFNLSHSGRVAVFALALMEIGIDTERICAERAIDAIAHMYISKNESQWLGALPSSKRDKAYFQIWTRKEALLKAIGTGLIDNLRDVPAGWPATLAVVCPADSPRDKWLIQNIGPFHGAVGALAYPSNSSAYVTCREFTLTSEPGV